MNSHLHSLFGKLFIVVAACAAFQRADATLLYEDGFNYPTGGLNNSDVSPVGLSGNAWGGGSSRITVVSGNLTYSGLQDLGGNSIQDTWTGAGSVFNTYADQNSGSIYYSFLLNATAISVGTNYLTALNPASGPPNGSSDALQVDVAASTASGTGYFIGLRTAGKSVTLDTTTVLSLNTTYLVVAEYTFGAVGVSAANLYLDPVPGGSQPTAAVTLAGSGTVTDIDDVGFKAQSTPADTFLMDNILIGTAWGDVTPVAVAPEPGTLSLVLAGMGALGLAARYRRVRK
jgi:PEP-CTERM motif